MTRQRLYYLLAAACIAGYVWLAYNLSFVSSSNNFGVCLIKEATSVPCPSCGSTRSVVSFLEGDLLGALYWNPIGIILVLILGITPFWLLYDLVAKSDSLLQFYLRIEFVFGQKMYAIPAIALVLANWIWNIYKGL